MSESERVGDQVAPDRPMDPFALRAMFVPPAYLAESAWLEHIPFAFWLIEAQRPKTLVELGVHNGASYFAFCQAIARLGLDARCFAVDAWKGDIHAGFYGEEVFDWVNAYNDGQYSAFSRLVRSTFEEAAAHFSDGSIDLLHIDGLHTLEAVRSDFENWLPKLSERAVVALHDTNVRERGFGVFKFFEEIRGAYPTFEFIHGHGLGIVGVGPRQDARVTRLFEIQRDPAQRRSVCEAFARLGRACAETFEAQRVKESLRALQRSLGEREGAAATLKAAAAALEAQLAARTAELNAAHAGMQEIAGQRDAFAAAAAAANGSFEARGEDIARLMNSLHDVQLRGAELEQMFQDAEARDAAARQEVGEAEARAARAEEDLRQLRHSLEQGAGAAPLLNAADA